MFNKNLRQKIGNLKKLRIVTVDKNMQIFAKVRLLLSEMSTDYVNVKFIN